MSSTATAKETGAANATQTAAIYSVCRREHGSPIGQGSLELWSYANGNLTGLLTFQNTIFNLSGNSAETPVQGFPTKALWLTGNSVLPQEISCALVLEKVIAPNGSVAMCGVIFLTQNNKITQGVMLTEPASMRSLVLGSDLHAVRTTSIASALCERGASFASKS